VTDVTLTSPCQAGCPVHTDAGGYARLVAEGRFDEAFEVVCRTNPFPSVCAHICLRLCEKECRRSPLDGSLALRALKRFLVQRAGYSGAIVPTPPEADREPVAVVGAGPAGLTAALDLRLRGFRVAVFERLDRPGGMLNVIPGYRLPQRALDADTGAILAAGIDVVYGCEIGRDRAATDLLSDGFKAVIIATGLSRSRGIAVPGFGGQHFTAAIPWLTDVWMGKQVEAGTRVAVIGGGSVAADVARTARRLGVQHVCLICLESRENMPADPGEVALAEAEGIDVLPGQALKRVLNRDGEIIGVELMAVVSTHDDSGRFKPVYDSKRIRTISANMVILSIGQAPDRSWARGTSLDRDRRGRIVADSETHLTGHPGVFLAGESLRGPGGAIEAVADGHRVAEVVAVFLETGRVQPPDRHEPEPLASWPPDVVEKLHVMRPVDTEVGPFVEGEASLSEQEATAEAFRCLGCLAGATIDDARCAACLTCYRVCPLDAVEIGGTMVADPVRCQACGVCASVCPAGAVTLTSDGLGALRDREPREADSIVLRCQHTDGGDAESDPAVLQCPARLRPVDILRLFAKGYRTVRLDVCSPQRCKYGSAWENIQSVAACVRHQLDRIGSGASLHVRVAGVESAGAALCPE